MNFRADGKFYGPLSKSPAVVAYGQTCEIRCGGDHDDSGRPKDFRLSGEGDDKISLTCLADGTWSGMPESPRECEAICDMSALDLDLTSNKKIRDEHKQFLQYPNDSPTYDCTNEDYLGSICWIVCPTGFKEWNDSKYPKSTTECTKKDGAGWNPAASKVNYCVPHCYPNC